MPVHVGTGNCFYIQLLLYVALLLCMHVCYTNYMYACLHHITMQTVMYTPCHCKNKSLELV